MGWEADQVPHRAPTVFVPPVPTAPTRAATTIAVAPATAHVAAASAAVVGPAPRRHGPKVSVFISIDLFIPLLRSALHAVLLTSHT